MRVKATYSAFVDNKAIIICILDNQLIGPLFNMEINFDVDFLVIFLPT